jgi:branched-subunit amino acid transport protein
MADWLYFVLIVLGMALATVLTRSAFLLLPIRWQPPPAALEALKYAPIAAIAAIVAPDLIAWRANNDSNTASAALNPKLIAAVFAALIHWKYRNMLLTIACGMAAFWALRYLLPLIPRLV